MPRSSPSLLLRSALDARQVKFIDELLSHPRSDAVEAAERAGYQRREVSALLANRAVRAAVETAKRYRADRMTAQQDHVLRRWAQIVRADPRELVEHWRVPCRRCWGHDHGYQFTDVELREAIATHRFKQLKLPAQDRAEFDDQGGGGFTINRDPCRGPDLVKFIEVHRLRAGLPSLELEANSDHSCPACYGHGTSYVYYHDTRHLSADAAALYLGMDETRNGMKIVMRSKPEAEQFLARHLGVLRPDSVPTDPREMTEEQVDAVLSAHGLTIEGDYASLSDVAAGEADGLPGAGDGAEAAASS